MRTTLTIDDDVLTVAKALAEQTKKTVGEVISDLARRLLRPPTPQHEPNGMKLLSVRKPGIIFDPTRDGDGEPK